LALAVFCALVGWQRSKASGGGANSRIKEWRPLPVQSEGGSMDLNVTVPTVWDEDLISGQLATIQGRPQLVAHYINTLKQRFILTTEDHTAQIRTRFLRSHLEHLELGKQYQTVLNDLKTMEAEQENRLLRLELERRELQAKSQHAGALEELRLEKERLAIKLEIEQFKAQKRAVTQPPQEESKLSPEQQRRLKRIEIEDRIERLDQQEEAALRKARDPEDRVRIQNMYADKREELRDQLSKNLV
jgi:hypothetical protein